MKKSIALFLLLTVYVHAVLAQTILPDPTNEKPSNARFYYRNLGQLTDYNGNLHPEIKYYTTQSFPSLFLADDKVSFVAWRAADTTIPGAQDSAGRIDMTFLCGGKKTTQTVPCGTISTYEPSQDYLNFYLPHCPNGITNVPGYARVVYTNAFPGIDVHWYSNNIALKSYIVINPGANPSDIQFQFSGQDSISVLNSGDLAMYLRGWDLKFPQATAYQIGNTGNIIPLTWSPLWTHNGAGTVSMTMGSYNMSQKLVIAIGAPAPKPTANNSLEWSVYYGNDGNESDNFITSDANDTMYHVMAHQGGSVNWPVTIGQTQAPGQYDFVISRFWPNAQREWTTYFGGSKDEFTASVKLAPNVGPTPGNLWVAGRTVSNNLPTGNGIGTYKQTSNGGQTTPVPGWNQDGIIAAFNKKDGKLDYATYFGGGGIDYIYDMSLDYVSNLMYIVGTTENNTAFQSVCGTPTLGKFPLCAGTGNRYFEGQYSTYTGGKYSFIAELNLNDRSLSWCTLIATQGYTEARSVYKLRQGTKIGPVNKLYVGGQTAANGNGNVSYPSPITSTNGSGKFPLTNPGNGAYFQYKDASIYNSPQYFVMQFDQNFQLNWSTFLGQSTGGISSFANNSKGEVYLTGTYADSYYSDTSLTPIAGGDSIPVRQNGIGYSQVNTVLSGKNLLLAKFGPNNDLKWSVLFGGNGQEGDASINNRSRVIVDDKDNWYVNGYTFYGLNGGNIPTYFAPLAYWQPDHSSAGQNDLQRADSWIAMFDTTDNLKWATHFGGYNNTQTPNDDNSYDASSDMTISGSHHYLFLTGATQCKYSPYNQCPPGAYCDMAYDMGTDGFLSRFTLTKLATAINEHNGEGATPVSNISVYPNPSDGIFTVSYKSGLTGTNTAAMEITNQIGRVLSKTTLSLQPGQNLFKIDLGTYATGIYIVRIVNNGVSTAAKLQKL